MGARSRRGNSRSSRLNCEANMVPKVVCAASALLSSPLALQQLPCVDMCPLLLLVVQESAAAAPGEPVCAQGRCNP